MKHVADWKVRRRGNVFWQAKADGENIEAAHESL